MTNIELARLAIAQSAQGSAIMGRDVVSRLSGPGAKVARVAIMRAITGIQTPVSQCGFRAVRAALYTAFNVSGGCIAERENNLRTAIEHAAA